MLIGELSASTSLSRDTIRFYEKQGLIEISKKGRRQNNYKEYSEGVLTRLNTIKRLKSFGFTLNEIADLLDMIDVQEATCNNVNELINKKVALLDVKIRDMIALRDQLINGVEKCTAVDSNENCPILITELDY
jgi:DNA-binding transcriptional MerR regulator